MSPGGAVTVFTHRRPADTGAAIATLREVAARAGATLRFDAEETRKHGLAPAAGIEIDTPPTPDATLCLCLGGDGTILYGLRAFARTGVPVFGVNYGEVGFLATIDPDGLRDGLERALRGDFETLDLPGIRLDKAGSDWLAVQRRLGPPAPRAPRGRPGLRDRPRRGRDACAATGSSSPRRPDRPATTSPTAGRCMAWGVEGFVVSFIAPHSLTARALVVAPRDVLRVANRSRDEPVEVTVDGRPVARAGSRRGRRRRASSTPRARLAQIPGATFYHRLRERFGRLAS